MNSSGRVITYLLAWLFLVSCVPTVTPFTPSPTVPPTLSTVEGLLNQFTIDEHCPRICWLGINPGVTSAEEARALLEASGKIEQLKVSETQIEANGPISNYIYPEHIFLRLENGLVKSIDFEGATGYVLATHLQLLGKPDEIRITIWADQHCQNIGYLLYFSSHKTVLEIPSGIWTGPDPLDWAYALILNTEFDDAFLQSRSAYASYYNQFSNRQPWVGYGHLQDYLPGQELPTGPCVPSGAAP